MDFDTLPTEIQFVIFLRTDAKALIHMSQTCKKYTYILTPEYDYVWKHQVYKFITPLYTYTTLQSYNEKNKTYFNSWFEVYKYAHTILLDSQNVITETGRGHVEMVKYIVEKGKENITHSAMENAIICGQLEVIKYLVHECKDTYLLITLLNFACTLGDFHTVKCLIENGVSPDGLTLSCATNKGHVEVVKYLLHIGVDVHSYDEAALHNACTSGYIEIVKILHQKGANITDSELLMRACRKGHVDVVRYLVEQGENIQLDETDALIESCQYGHLNVIQYLIEQGANIHRYNEQALWEACVYGDVQIIQYLINCGANIQVHIQDALMYTSQMGYVDVVDFLLKYVK